MNDKLVEALKARFGEQQLELIYYTNTQDEGLKNYPFICIRVKKRSEISILMTSDLSTYRMPVMEKHLGREHNELYFCIPSYWDLSDHSNPRMNWVFETLYRLRIHVKEKNTWFGIGHTIPHANPICDISPSMKQKYYFLNEPWLLKEDLEPLKNDQYLVHFLAVLPIFEDEFDYKIGKGTYKFQKKLKSREVTELLDDFRFTILKSRWRILG